MVKVSSSVIIYKTYYFLFFKINKNKTSPLYEFYSHVKFTRYEKGDTYMIYDRSTLYQ